MNRRRAPGTSEVLAARFVTQAIYVRCIYYKIQNGSRTISTRAANNCDKNKERLRLGLRKCRSEEFICCHSVGPAVFRLLFIVHIRVIVDIMKYNYKGRCQKFYGMQIIFNKFTIPLNFIPKLHFCGLFKDVNCPD